MPKFSKQQLDDIHAWAKGGASRRGCAAKMGAEFTKFMAFWRDDPRAEESFNRGRALANDAVRGDLLKRAKTGSTAAASAWLKSNEPEWSGEKAPEKTPEAAAAEAAEFARIGTEAHENAIKAAAEQKSLLDEQEIEKFGLEVFHLRDAMRDIAVRLGQKRYLALMSLFGVQSYGRLSEADLRLVVSLDGEIDAVRSAQ
jgi:hypothetical protein